MVTTTAIKMAATIPSVRSEDEVVSISGEQLVPLQSSVGVEEGRKGVGREQSIPLHSSVGVRREREERSKQLVASISTDQLNY